MQRYVPLSCDECQGEIHLVTSVASFGGLAGARFYECKDCGHLQVEDVTAPPAPRCGDMNFRPESA